MYTVTHERDIHVIRIDVRGDKPRKAFFSVLRAIAYATAFCAEGGGATPLLLIASVTHEVASMFFYEGEDDVCYLAFDHREGAPKYAVVLQLEVFVGDLLQGDDEQEGATDGTSLKN